MPAGRLQWDCWLGGAEHPAVGRGMNAFGLRSWMPGPASVTIPDLQDRCESDSAFTLFKSQFESQPVFKSQ